MVAADDRTGAFEVAALFAAVVGPVTVGVGQPVNGSCVVDIGSRDAGPETAASRAETIDAQPSAWTAHKMDSTLRGNWAAELLARQARSGRRVVVIPGWPELGRTCADGVVSVHGTPVGSVLQQLPNATVVRGVAALREWLGSGSGIAVCDVPDSAEMTSLASVAGRADVLVAGPAGPLGAAFVARNGAPIPSPVSAVPPVSTPVLVVCGSANPVSREQLARLAAARPDIRILSAPDAEGPLHVGVAHELVAAAHRVADELQPATIVLVGGDTAAAFLGDGPRRVGGTVAPGMPWSRDIDDGGPLVITKAGGFGTPDSLVALLSPGGG